MASPNLLASAVMDGAAARVNDVAKTIYPYATQLPYLSLALTDLEEIYQANNVPTTDQTQSDVIEVDADSVSRVIEIAFAPDPPIANTPYLPDDLIEIKVAWQSSRGLNQWTRFQPVDYIPQYQIGAQISTFNYYQWATNCMKLLSANADNDIRLDYIRSIFPVTITASTDLLVINGKNYLINRTAYYLAADIEENDIRAAKLANDANMSLDSSLTIATKGRQKIQTRRMPFRAGYKARNSGSY